MNELPNFFYAFTPEDQQAQALQAASKIDLDGHVLNPVCDEVLFELDDEEIQILRSAINREEQAYSRHSYPLGKFSLLEVAKATNTAAQALRIPKPQYILRGSVLRQLLKKRHIKIYEAWFGQPVTPLYQTNLKILNNDRDWVILVENIKQLDAIRRMIDYGLTSRIVENLQQQKIKPTYISLNLAQAHRAAKSSPPESYAHETAKNQGKEISADDPRLLTKYVELCGYRRAFDKKDVEKEQAHAERVLAGKEAGAPDDYNFTNTPPTTATPIHSLYVNVTPLVNDAPIERFKLQCVLGPAARLQAICDQVLGNLTRDPQQPIGSTNFVGSLSHFTLGGRAYEAGGIEDNFRTLKEEAKKRKITWSEMLASQLISRVKYHHRNEPEVLIALTFNASAILAWKNPKLLEEIQQLWKIVLGQVDKLEIRKSSSACAHNSLIEHILMNMRDPNFRFIDVYVQMQATAMIEQNRHKVEKGAFSTFSTQTDGHVFNQIAVPVHLGAGAPPRLYLFFPYDLLRSLKHLAYLHSNKSSSTALNMLRHLHEVIIPSKEIFFIMEGSLLAGYYEDPRRQSEQCFEESRKLIKKTDERAWKTGFLVACSLLSQKKSDHFIKKLMLDLMRMLLAQWPSMPFKKEMAAVFSKTLIKSGIFFTETFFDKLMQPSERSKLTFEKLVHVTSACLKTDLAPFISAAAEFLDANTGQCHVGLYRKLGAACLSKAYAPDEIAANALYFLTDSLIRQPHISHIHKIELLCHLYPIKKVQDNPVLGKKIVEAIFSQLSALVELPDPKNLVEVFKLFLRHSFAEMAPAYFRELARLKVISTPELAQELWGSLMQLVPEKDDRALYNYLSGCLSTAKEFRLWPWLQKSEFIEKYTAVSHRLSKQTGKAAFIARLHSLEAEDLHQTIRKSHIQSVQEQLPTAKDAPAGVSEELRWLHCTWQEAALVAELIAALCQVKLTETDIRKLYAFLDNFQRANGPQQPDQMGTFWLDQLSRQPSDSAVTLMLLQLVIAFVSHSEYAPKFSNDFYLQLIAVVLAKQAKGEESVLGMPKTIVNELHQRRMANEILALAAAGSIPYSDDHLQIMGDVINQAEAIESYIEKLPEWIVEDEAISSQLTAKCHHLAKHACDAKDYSKALYWLNQILIKNRPLDEALYDLAFTIFKGLIITRKLQEACGLILSLPDEPGHEKEWLDICSTLLEVREVSACTQLILQNTSIKNTMKDPSFSHPWIDIIGKVKDNMRGSSRHEIHQLCILLNQVIRTLNPSDPQVWTDYIQLLSKYGSLAQVEELFWYLQKDDKIVSIYPDIKIRMTSCWIPIFEKFNSQGSQALLKLIGSAKRVEGPNIKSTIPILTEYLTRKVEVPEESYAIFFSHIVGGILKSLNQSHRNEKRQITQLFFQSIDNDALVSIPNYYDYYQIFVDIAELAFMVETDKSLCDALYAALTIFVHMKLNPIFEDAAVRIMNRGVKLALHSKNQQVLNAAATLIGLVQKSDYCEDGDHFLYLEFLHKFEDKETVRKLFETRHSGSRVQALQMANFYMEEKLSSLTKVIVNPYSRQQYTPAQKKLVEKTVGQLWYFPQYFGEDLIASLESPNINVLTTPETRNMIRQIIYSYNHELHYVVKAMARLQRSHHIADLALRRMEIAGQFNQKFRLMPGEIRAIQHYQTYARAVSWCKKAAIIAVCALAILFLWSKK